MVLESYINMSYIYVGSMSDTGSDCTTLSKAVEKTLANEIKVKLLFLQVHIYNVFDHYIHVYIQNMSIVLLNTSWKLSENVSIKKC